MDEPSGKQLLTTITLDILKPHEPSILDLAEKVNALKGVKKVIINISEVDAETETIKMSVIGNNINFQEIKRTIEENGGAIHSIDHVSLEKLNSS